MGHSFLFGDHKMVFFYFKVNREETVNTGKVEGVPEAVTPGNILPGQGLRRLCH